MATRRLFTAKEINMMKNPNLSSKQISDILGRNYSVIRRARARYLTDEQKRTRKYSHSNDLMADNSDKYKPYTIQDLKDIVNSNMNDRELSVMYGRSPMAINKIRQTYNYLKEAN